ncbi:PKD domain-containing protein [Natronorubrum daqingense]|uniref:PKD domain-containing protein n=1 Tax=Natronorubrum daqingense TaxID=588898 RepID=A0A1P8RD79_9EURY|nr:PKD domain-containing protein [Natronorubrum daqingense]APX96551.1 hypothetical protein BB347_07940 [Natronorubrum daqingense]
MNETDDNDDDDDGSGGGISLPPPDSGGDSSDDLIGSTPSGVITQESESGTVSQTEPTTFVQTAVESLEFEDPDPSWSVAARDLNQEPATNGDAPGETLGVSMVSVSDSAVGESTTMEFALDPATLEGVSDSASASEVRIFAATDDGWEPLGTSVVEEGEGGSDHLLETETSAAENGVYAVSHTGQPTAAIDLATETVAAGEDLEFSADASIDSDYDLESFEWTIDDTEFEGETAVESIDEPGEYTVWLTVTNEAGETDSTSSTLTVDAADDEADDDGIPAGGPVLVALAAVVTALVARARNWLRNEAS